MDIYRLISTISAVLSAAMIAYVVFTYRHERRIGRWSALVPILVSLAILVVFLFLSGAWLNPVVAAPVLVLGLLIGYLRGLSTRLYFRDGQVVGRNSQLFLLGWGGSVVLVQVLNTWGSVALASVGLLTVYLGTGTQVGINANIFLRRMRMRPPPPAIRRAGLGLPERGSRTTKTQQP